MIKILFVGMGMFPMYEKAFYKAAKSMQNLEADLFSWEQEVKKNSLFIRAEIKMSAGPDVIRLNKRLIRNCREQKYDIVFLYTCRFILPGTVKKLKDLGCYIALYCNDNPFSDYYPNYFWRHWRNSVRYCDITYVYRLNNIEDCRKIGARRIKVLRSYYMKERNYYIPDEEIDRDVPEVVFIGHRENDERDKYLHALVASGIRIGLPSNEVWNWGDFEPGSDFVVRLVDPQEGYNEILNKAKIALVFLSKLNHDTYTRRCFEIPAVKTLMMSVYTEDIASMFEEDREVVFFRNEEELVEKVHFYLQNPEKRKEIAENGFLRLSKDGHSAEDRVNTVVDDYIVREL